MKNKIAIVALAGLSTSFAFAGPVPKAIKARYMTLQTAIRQVNFKAFQGFFAEDFTSVDPSGKSANRTEFLAGVKPLFDSSTKSTLTEKFLDSKTHDGLVDVKTDLVVNLVGKMGTTKVHEVCTDTWKVVGKQWLMVKTVDTKFDVVMPKVKKASKSKAK